MHPTRARSLRDLEQLAQDGEWERLYQRTVLREFPDDALMGFQLAFYRPFAVPRMARVLAGSGEFVTQTEKRSYDTGLVMYEIIAAGLDHPTARRLVGLVNRLHRRYDIPAEDFTYVLCAFVVVPLRHLERFGWRPVLAVEREASWRFYHRLGELMGIARLPTSYAEAESLLDAYEQRMVAPSPEGRALSAAVLRLLRRRLPLPARPLARHVNAALLGDDRIAAALDLPVGSRPAVALGRLARVPGWIRARGPAPTASWFTPGQPAGAVYRHGYRLDDLGPSSGRA